MIRFDNPISVNLICPSYVNKKLSGFKSLLTGKRSTGQIPMHVLVDVDVIDGQNHFADVEFGCLLCEDVLTNQESHQIAS